MGGFRRAFLGYRREDVDAAIAIRDSRVAEWEKAVAERDGRLQAVDAELNCLSGMVLERERESATLRDQLREAEDRHERSLEKLEVIIQRVEELQAAARGHATRIRMKALREAVEVSERAQSLTQRMDFAGQGGPPGSPRSSSKSRRSRSRRAGSRSRSGRSRTFPSCSSSRRRPKACPRSTASASSAFPTAAPP